MRHGRRAGVGIFSGMFLLALLGVGHADELTLEMLEVAVMTSEMGESRVLFRTEDWAATSSTVVTSASLTLPSSGWSEADSSEASGLFAIQVLPVSEAWSSIGAEWDERWLDASRGSFGVETYARELIDPSRAARSDFSLDLTGVVKQAIDDGTFANGFLLAVPASEGSGLDERELGAFASLGRARLTIRFKNVAPPPARRLPGRR